MVRNKVKSNTCSAITKKGRKCPIEVEEWREFDLCHVHDPRGKFRQQQFRKGKKYHVYTKPCNHKWYMRDTGVTCIECGEIW